MQSNDDDIKQGIGWLAKIGGYTIKKVSASDDLKDHVLTITLTRTSSGWHQERLPFEDTADQVATVDGNGHVESVTTLDPSDLTEKDETLAQAVDPDEATSEPDVVDEKAPDIHLVGEVAAAARKRR